MFFVNFCDGKRGDREQETQRIFFGARYFYTFLAILMQEETMETEGLYAEGGAKAHDRCADGGQPIF